jgi:hypothetical protein
MKPKPVLIFCERIGSLLQTVKVAFPHGKPSPSLRTARKSSQANGLTVTAHHEGVGESTHADLNQYQCSGFERL